MVLLEIEELRESLVFGLCRLVFAPLMGKETGVSEELWEELQRP